MSLLITRGLSTDVDRQTFITRGLGGLIILPKEELFQKGVGVGTILQAFSPRAPCVTIIRPEKKK